MMPFKIDENLHSDAAELLQQHGHDALTVFQQGLRGEVDANIADVCRREARAIITLDLDFSDIRNLPTRGLRWRDCIATERSKPSINSAGAGEDHPLV